MNGNFNPMLLGRLLAARNAGRGERPATRTLTEVRIYTGAPTEKDPRGQSAHRRRAAQWRKDGVVVVERSLRYPFDYPKSKPQEKGIDVALAIDLVALGINGTYDIAMLFSNDTDLRPAVAFVRSNLGKRIELATWMGSNPLEQPGGDLWCHFFTRAEYDRVADLTDYNFEPTPKARRPLR